MSHISIYIYTPIMISVSLILLLYNFIKNQIKKCHLDPQLLKRGFHQIQKL